MKGLRYLLYLAFALAALIFWPLYFMLVLGMVPFPAEPACVFEPGGCPPPTFFERVLGVVSIFGAIPVTALAFVFYRKWVHRLLHVEKGSS